jgi:hypothetical protein
MIGSAAFAADSVHADEPEDTNVAVPGLRLVPSHGIADAEELRNVCLRHQEYEAIGRAADQANDYGAVRIDLLLPLMLIVSGPPKLCLSLRLALTSPAESRTTSWPGTPVALSPLANSMGQSARRRPTVLAGRISRLPATGTSFGRSG